MSTTTKLIITYIGGIVTGVVLTIAFCFALAVSQSNNNEASSNDELQLFESPKQVMNAESFKVIQVLPNGSALATYKEFSRKAGDLEYGTVVLFQASENSSYYDDQVIKLPKGKCFKQIGTYRYVTRQEMEKTVPVIGIFDK